MEVNRQEADMDRESIKMLVAKWWGEVPTQLCQLNRLRLVDLSHNNLFGHLPPCLDVTALHDSDHDIVSPSSISMPPVDSISMPPTPTDGPIFMVPAAAPDNGPPMRKEETVEFRTKSNSYFYQGKVLTGMFGIDLSCNKLTVCNIISDQKVDQRQKVHGPEELKPNPRTS
ncbi:hypothetical protein Dsin_010412 [Dipteronia sinensis]|uniref:Uncharacterized protein n=1 Tax=Dipteronia sinensis TaxID=43782 RepID=A0AAE0ED13_9ROSI|nr:hypothetical protein Dsin_010412 [Dipteronia sinensis]